MKSRKKGGENEGGGGGNENEEEEQWATQHERKERGFLGMKLKIEGIGKIRTIWREENKRKRK